MNPPVLVRKCKKLQRRDLLIGCFKRNWVLLQLVLWNI
jgi:hypothetical protein